MAFDEKKLKQLQRQNRPQPLDRFDLEAEREGDARRFFKGNNLSPANGRRIARQNRELNGYGKTAEKRGTDYIVRETAARAAQIIVPEPKRYNLAQVN